MQSKTFSQISFLVVMVITGLIMVNITKKAIDNVPIPEFSDISTSTDPYYSDQPVMDPYFIIPPATTLTDITDQPIVVATTTIVKPNLTHIVAKASIIPVKTNFITYTIPLKTPNGSIKALVASSSEAREQGLSDRDSMSTDTGMLFAFPQSDKYGFWMKDMKFPLDFIWISSDKKVTGIYRNISPNSYPKVYYSRQPVMFVLELNAGGARKWGIATGTQLVF